MNPGDRKNLAGIAIDLGGTKTAIARISQGEVVEYQKVATDGSLNADELLQTLIPLARDMKIVPADRLGVAVTGRVDEKGYWYAVNQSALSQIDKVPLQELLSSQFERSVPVFNDALAGALAEQRFGAGTNASRMAYITVSTGVGAGIVLDGLPFKSPRGLAGHAGFTSSRFSKEYCGSGRLATVESVASGSAIALAAGSAGHPGITAEGVFAAYHAAEPWASSIIKQSAAAIADLCADLVALLDIDLIVLGGGVGLAKGYCEEVQVVVNTMPVLFQVPVVVSTLGTESVLFGALIDH